MENPAAPVAPGRRSLLCNSRIPRVSIQPPRKDLTDLKIRRRVFGTTRNPNVPTKPPPPPPAKKPLVRIRKAPIRKDHNVSENQANVKSHKQGKRIPEEKTDLTIIDSVKKGGSSSPRTPTVHSSEADRLSSETTPYYTGEICNKSWIDRLEMSSYWLNQIKLAEASGKNFVSAAFFRLAMESKAEPIESLRDELKQYLARNVSLCSENQWIDVSSMYGLSR